MTKFENKYTANFIKWSYADIEQPQTLLTLEKLCSIITDSVRDLNSVDHVKHKIKAFLINEI